MIFFSAVTVLLAMRYLLQVYELAINQFRGYCFFIELT